VFWFGWKFSALNKVADQHGEIIEAQNGVVQDGSGSRESNQEGSARGRDHAEFPFESAGEGVSVRTQVSAAS